VLPAKERRPYITLVQPFSRYMKLALLTDTNFAVPLSLKAIYYFFKTRFVESRKRAGDLRSTLKILQEEAVVYKDMVGEAFKIMEREPALRSIIMGHTHVALVRTGPGDRRYINTGTWTKHINLDLPELGAHTRWTYAKIDYREDPSNPDIGLFRWLGSQHLTTEVRY
jgi:hypothetical protein